jgi:TctA family transporter
MATRAIRLKLNRLDLSRILALLLSFNFVFIFKLISFLYLSRLVFSFTSGTSSPKWVQTPAEGGGFFMVCFLLHFLALCGLEFFFMFAIIFVYIAIMAEGRKTRLNK